MNRQNIINEDNRIEGWFDLDTALRFSEDTRWNGNNYISISTGSQWDHEELYRTKGGRWVLHTWSQWQGSVEYWEFITAAQAKNWLLLNNDDAAVIRFFGPIEEESGP